MNNAFDRAKKVMIGFMLTFALLVATHLGEFWPLSIYPMFSQAGKPWERAIVRTTAYTQQPFTKWDTLTTLDQLPGAPFKMTKYNLAQNDFANYLKKTKVWDAKKKEAVLAMFGGLKPDSSLVLYKAGGRMGEDGKVHYHFVPLIVVNNQSLSFNPALQVR
jgi:hypothetical protein